MTTAERSPRRYLALLGAAATVGLGAFFALRTWREAGSSEGFKERVSSLAQDLVRDHWTAMRKAVEQVGTDEGARAFYEANPGLAERIPTEQSFVARTQSWRRLLSPLPETMPSLETHNLSYQRKLNEEEMSYRFSNGAFIFMRWAEGRLVEMRVY